MRVLIPLLLLHVLMSSVCGCATKVPLQPMQTRPVRPEVGEIVVPARSILAFDASGSIDRLSLYPVERNFVRSFVAAMPPGTYDSSLIVVGGKPRDGLKMERFDRFRLDRAVNRTPWRGNHTPMTQVIEELAASLSGLEGSTALILLTDGVPTRYGKYIGPDEALAATDLLLEAPNGPLCIHTIQVGSDERGLALLEPMASRSTCGSFHRMEELATPEDMARLQRQIFIGPAPPPPPPKIRRMTDLDKDGIDDRFDRCARTPEGAVVDDRGCWVIEDTVFDRGSATIRADQTAPLTAVFEVLEGNERLRIRIDGHTDDVGTAEFNMRLSQSRADAVRDWLVQAGVPEERLRTRAFGPARPATANNSASNRARNRRVEISVLDD